MNIIWVFHLFLHWSWENKIDSMLIVARSMTQINASHAFRHFFMCSYFKRLPSLKFATGYAFDMKLLLILYQSLDEFFITFSDPGQS